jgi:hypothetical protein
MQRCNKKQKNHPFKAHVEIFASPIFAQFWSLRVVKRRSNLVDYQAVVRLLRSRSAPAVLAPVAAGALAPRVARNDTDNYFNPAGNTM